MDSTICYCRRCQQRFAAGPDDPYCLECRQQLVRDDAAPTLDLTETLCHEAGGGSADLRHEFLGRSFSGYTIDGFLGKGGMAWVFRARHNSLQRPCAIKILSPELRQRNPEFLQLFIAEARAAASVVHPHIVTVHNIGQTGPYHFIELEYVPGPSLQAVLQAAGRFSPLRATGFLLQTCAALAEAHRCHLIHRDFKPSNVLVGHNDFAKLADFGLAKRVAAEPQTGGDKLAGTPHYMAPELFRGCPADTRSDVYAVGVSYYYLLTGQFPFAERSLPKLVRMHAELPPPDPRCHCPDLPGEVLELLNRCLAKDPQQRPQDGSQLHEELRESYLRLRDIRSLVAEAAAQLQLPVADAGDRLMVQVPLPGGRQQRVYVEDRRAGPWAEQLVKIYSLCCPARESYFRTALELNANLAHGSLAIEQVEGQAYFVMANRYPRATCDAEEIRQSIVEISQWADQVEQLLTGLDCH